MKGKDLRKQIACFSRMQASFMRPIQVADLAEMRKRVGTSPSHWWWYLEKLIQVEKVSRGRP
ncbi:MAG: hypothetical protein J7L32_06245 [Thermoplasmata archaeon]|nr:hypothetical protein [Thermoplasmata archaeon]